jgi:hypothetical protein
VCSEDDAHLSSNRARGLLPDVCYVRLRPPMICVLTQLPCDLEALAIWRSISITFNAANHTDMRPRRSQAAIQLCLAHNRPRCASMILTQRVIWFHIITHCGDGVDNLLSCLSRWRTVMKGECQLKRQVRVPALVLTGLDHTWLHLTPPPPFGVCAVAST